MTPRDYGPTCHNTGIILVPPVFGAQLEVIIVAVILKPTQSDILKKLKDLIQDNRRHSWFTIYLCLFILLHNCALLTAADNKKARKQGLQHRFFRVSLVEELHIGAKILLAYFHYCCKGSYPMSMDWNSPEEIALAEMDDEQVEFMRESLFEFKKRVLTMRNIRDEANFEHELFFLSQLYDVNWKPVDTI